MMKSTEEPLLSIEQLSYALPTSEGLRPLLHEINISIRQGEWIALAGSNGSGKSTLAKLMAGLAAPTQGHVVYHMDEQADPASFLQLIFQNPDMHLFGENVYEEVCFSMETIGVPPEEIRHRAEEALRKVGLASKLHAAVASLSGGQKQLLSVAGCLAVHPSVLVFDEVTSMLDPMSREKLLQVVRERHREGMTIVWITQLLDELVYADRVYALDEGRLIYEGSPRSFFYGNDTTVCERLGFTPPYTVQVIRELRRQGIALKGQPLTPEELAEAVSQL